MPETEHSLSESHIRALASSQSFERGSDYYRSGAVSSTRRVGADKNHPNELRGHCHGSSDTPYRVSAQLGAGGVVAAHCTCPYDWGGICKHLVALLLTWVHNPDAFQSVAAVDERLAGKSKEELIALIQEMLRREPDLERLLDLPLRPDSDSPLDLDAFRRQIDFILQDDFPDPQEVALELEAILEAGDRFAEEERWTAAGAIYHLILSEIIPYYDQLYDEDGDISSVLGECSQGLESCLMEGSPDEATRQVWFDTLLEAEFKDVAMGGIDLVYPAWDILLEHATDEEWMGIEGRVREKIAAMTDQYSRWRQETLVRLLAQRLERTGREAEIPDLIFELGSVEQRAFELLRQGQFAEAITMAEEHFGDLPGLVLKFADALMGAGGTSEAVAYINGQLDTRYRSHYLPWLARTAEKQQDPETALKWWLGLLLERPSLEHYLNLRETARQIDQWDSMRPDLIRRLEAEQKWFLLIEIALEEGEVARAIELLPRQYWPQHDLRVAQAAESSHPRAAMQIYSRRVEQLINARGRGNYQEAASILQRGKALYQQQRMTAEWERFMTELRQRYARLRALMDELDKADL